jgi:hypothetical protein
MKLVIAAVALACLAFSATTANAGTISAKQASLDDHQTSCTDSGGTLTSWHFIINQIRPIANAPEYIEVTWSNGDVESVFIAKTSGPVAHYNVEGSADHTFIESATADIYDRWSGQFNLSHVECGPAIPPPSNSCTELEGEMVFVIDQLLDASNQAGDVFNVNIPTGEYTVTLQSFDDHAADLGQDQQTEQWRAVFGTPNGDVSTNPISDLPLAETTLTEEVDTVWLPDGATTLTAVHLLFGQTFSTPESIKATCLVLNPALD